MDVTRPRATKLSQITIDANLDLGTHLLKFVDLLIKQLSADSLVVRNIGDTADKNIQGLYVIGSNRVQTDIVSELTGAHGVEVDGVDLKDNFIALAGLPNAHDQYLISEDIKHSHDAQVQTTSDTYVKLKTITITQLYTTPNTIRVRMDINNSETGITYVKVYKNGAAFSTEENNNTESWETESWDLSFAEGDTIEAWAHKSATYPSTSYLKNFRVHGEDLPLTYHQIADEGMVGVADPFIAANATP